MHESIPLGLSFDDVLLVPQFSEIQSRSMVDTSSQLVEGIILKTPIISANMDTVTESNMAIAMAKLGGIGFIHRFLNIEQEVIEVSKVKRHRSQIIKHPYCIDVNRTAEDVRLMMEEKSVGALLVTKNNSNTLEGIISRRDLHNQPDGKIVEQLMTEKYKVITGSLDIKIEEAENVMFDNRIEQLPLVDDKHNIQGLIVAKDIQTSNHYHQATLDTQGRLQVVASVGVTGDYIERAIELEKADADALVLDVAHAHAKHVGEALTQLVKNVNIPIVVGNVATAEGAEYLIKNGASAIKVGIGPGAACITRLVAGAGYPQLSAIIEASSMCHKHNIPVIADGGIRRGGDLAKAIGAGGDIAMLGSVLASAQESPGKVEERNNMLVKTYRGMASADAFRAKQEAEGKIGQEKVIKKYVAEGISSTVPYLGQTAEDIITSLVGGLKSGMAYSNSKNIKEFHQQVKFIQQTQSGQAESRPHVLER